MRYTTVLPAAFAAALLLSGAGSALAQSTYYTTGVAVAPSYGYFHNGGPAISAEGLITTQDDREVHALNWLEAAGFRNFGTVTAVGPNFQVVAMRNGMPVTVIVNPETGQISGG
jgi:hypothetical protein